MDPIKTGKVTIMTCVPPFGFAITATGAVSSELPDKATFAVTPPKTVHKIKLEKQPDGSLLVLLLGDTE